MTNAWWAFAFLHTPIRASSCRMTTRHAPQPAPDKPTRRCNADYRWTKPKVLAFLRALARCGKVAEAARSVGMSREAAFRLKRRLADPVFQNMWALAIRTGLAVRAEAREEARMARSVWGEAGLAGLAHLRGAGSQGHALQPQDHALARKVTF